MCREPTSGDDLRNNKNIKRKQQQQLLQPQEHH